MESYSEIETQIIQALNIYTDDAARDNIRSNRDWTSRLFERLGLLGESLNYNVCASGFGRRFSPEWLFDLVWYDEVGEGINTRLVDVSLVVESEWHTSFAHIKYDFEKLLVANARRRLFICYINDNSLQSMKEYFIEAIQKFQLGHTGDRFLIAMMMMNTNEFEYQLIVRN